MAGTTVAETQRRGLIAELAELQPVKRTFFAEHRTVQDFHFDQECQGVLFNCPPRRLYSYVLWCESTLCEPPHFQ